MINDKEFLTKKYDNFDKLWDNFNEASFEVQR